MILNFFGLEKIGMAINGIFGAFKQQTYYLLFFTQNAMRFQQATPKSVLFEKTQEKSWFCREMLEAVARFLEKLDYRHQYYMEAGLNQFEKLEKARFFMEQELGNLEEILRDMQNNKSEIDGVLKNKGTLKNVTHSGLNHFLEGFLDETKKVAIGLNHFLEEEKKEDIKYADLIKIDFQFEDIKSGLLKSVKSKRLLQKVVTANRRSLIVNLCEQEAQTDINSEAFVTTDALENLTNESMPSSIPGLRRLVTNLNFEKKDLSSKLLFANQKLETVQVKLQAAEKKLKFERESNGKLREVNGELDFKVQRKRTKIKNLKAETKELLSKLEHYVDKDQMNRVMLLSKSEDLQRTALKSSEKEKAFLNELGQKTEEIKTLNQKLSSLNDQITTLQEEKTQLQDLLSFEQDKKQEISPRHPDSNEFSNPSSFRNPHRSPSFLNSNSEAPNSNPARPRRPSFVNDSRRSHAKGSIALPLPRHSEDDQKGAKKPEKNAVLRIEFEPTRVAARPLDHSTPRITVKTEGASPLIKTSSPRAGGGSDKGKHFFGKAMDRVIEELSKAKDQETFEKNLNYLLEHKDLNLVKESAYKLELQEKIKEIEAHLSEERLKTSKLCEKIEKEREKNTENQRKTENTKEKSLSQQKPNQRRTETLRTRESTTPEKIISGEITLSKTPNSKEKQLVKSQVISTEKTKENSNKNSSVFPQNPQNEIKYPPKTSHLRVRTEQTPTLERIVTEKSLGNPRTSKKLINFAEKRASKTPKINSNLISKEDLDEDYLASMILEQSSKESFDLDDLKGNFAKKKFLYKYPFKKFTEFKSEKIDDEKEFFERVFTELVKRHESCGPNCGHLGRFYSRIPFIARHRHKQRLIEQRTVIDKLPSDFN